MVQDSEDHPRGLRTVLQIPRIKADERQPLSAANHPAIHKNSGARGGTRTPTPLLASGPKPGASTNFATRAEKSWALNARTKQACFRFNRPFEIG
jgi:hypothetical protein